jgi:hypothetical protein
MDTFSAEFHTAVGFFANDPLRGSRPFLDFFKRLPPWGMSGLDVADSDEVAR